MLLSWRNETNAKRYSRSNLKISPKVHGDWLKIRLLNRSAEPILIFQFESKAIGMTRLDLINGRLNHFEISVIVSETFQGRGFATSMIDQTLEFAKENLKAIGIIAIIHKHNLVSKKLFTKLTFQKVSSLQNEFDEYLFHF